MANTGFIGWLRRNRARTIERDPISARARRQLVRTLYQNPASLLVGAICGVANAGVVALVVGSPVFIAGFALLALIAAIRVALAYGLFFDESRTSSGRLETIYQVGAFSYAIAFGMLGAAAIAYQTPVGVQMLMAGSALCYGVAICARNAGRPGIALGQLLLVTVPVMTAAVYAGTLPFLVLALNIVLLFPAMASITLTVFGVLRDSIAAAETSARLAEKMQRLARTDVVTGLKNRAGLEHEIAERLSRPREGGKLALVWIDLDRFKEVNDLLGHQAGDSVLAATADRLRHTAERGTAIARFGGDEFVMLADTASRADAEALVARFAASLSEPMQVENERLDVSVSIGVALLPDDGVEADELMKHADIALYEAKVNGRGQTRFYDPAMSRELVRKRQIEAELRLAIQRNELTLFYQPIIDLQTGRIRAFEALVRWFHPLKGELRPDEFIPVAEDTGVIVTLGNWITKEAALACSRWPDHVSVAVNLSPVQLRAPGAVLGIEDALRKAKLSPARLELEVTESVFLEDNEETAAFVRELSARGVRFALDDFGTGYSSLGYLHKFPFDKIKVDRSFVSGDNTGPKSDAIIRAVAEMGATLEMEIVAEGLETVEQVHAVRAAGCTLGQGFYFSRAVSDHAAAMLLASENDAGHTGHGPLDSGTALAKGPATPGRSPESRQRAAG